MGRGPAACKGAAGRASTWTARTGCVPSVGPGFSPLDQVLEVPTEQLTPTMVTYGVQLALLTSFARAADLLEEHHQVRVTGETLRRITESLGTEQVARDEAEVQTIERTLPEPSHHPSRRVVLLDGAFVPVRGDEAWAEVKLLVGGEPQVEQGEVRLRELSYFARLADATTFGRAILGELTRRGVDGAREVAAISDGAPWIQEVIDRSG